MQLLFCYRDRGTVVEYISFNSNYMLNIMPKVGKIFGMLILGFKKMSQSIWFGYFRGLWY